MLINPSLIKAHCMDFIRLYLVDALKKDVLKRKTVALYTVIFVGLLLFYIFVFHHVLSLSHFVMFFGIYSGFIFRLLLKDPFGGQVAGSCGLTVALAFIMLSFFLMILL